MSLVYSKRTKQLNSKPHIMFMFNNEQLFIWSKSNTFPPNCAQYAKGPLLGEKNGLRTGTELSIVLSAVLAQKNTLPPQIHTRIKNNNHLIRYQLLTNITCQDWISDTKSYQTISLRTYTQPSKAYLQYVARKTWEHLSLFSIDRNQGWFLHPKGGWCRFLTK